MTVQTEKDQVVAVNEDQRPEMTAEDISKSVKELREQSVNAFCDYLKEAREEASTVIKDFNAKVEPTAEDIVKYNDASVIISNLDEVESQSRLFIHALSTPKPLEVTTSKRLIKSGLDKFYHFTRSRQISISRFDTILDKVVATNTDGSNNSLLNFLYYFTSMFASQTIEERESMIFYYRTTLGLVMTSVFSGRRVELVERLYQTCVERLSEK